MIKDLVTVIIPVYKKKIEYLRDSLKSVVNQTYNNIEIIVVDDGSNKYNKILKICNSFNKKITIIKSKKNKGVSAALNKGILKSNGKYINWLSHDDIFLPTKIEEQIKLLAGSEHKISITNFIIWNVKKNKKKKFFLCRNDFINFHDSLLLKDIYNFCTLLVPRKMFINNLFNEKLQYVQDYDMFLKLSQMAEIVFSDKHLFVSRVHAHQTSLEKKKLWIKEKNRFYANHIFFYENIINKKKSFFRIFSVLFLIHRKRLKELSLNLDKKIKILNNKKLIFINIVIKNLIKLLYVFKEN
jgi:glycosyltransferase involved in cell wall biosynthesis